MNESCECAKFVCTKDKLTGKVIRHPKVVGGFGQTINPPDREMEKCAVIKGGKVK